MCEQNHYHPRELIRILGRFLCQTVDQSANPNSERNNDNQAVQCEHEKDSVVDGSIFKEVDTKRPSAVCARSRRERWSAFAGLAIGSVIRDLSRSPGGKGPP